MKLSKLVVITGVLLMVLAPATTAWGQEGSDPAVKAWPKKPSFSIRLGSYFASSNGTIRIDGENQGTEIDWHDVLNTPTNATVVRGRADVRIAKWFGVEAEYYRIARSQTATLDSEITIGDEIIAIDQTIASSLVQSYLDTALKFYLVHRKRLDLGLWLGATVHFVDFSIEAEPSGAAIYKNPWYPVPALGVHFSYSILPRLYLYGKAGYFKYKATEPTTKIDAVRFDITLDYYFWKALGIGVTYAYVDNSVELEKSPLMGKVSSVASGIQIYGVIGF